MKFSKITSGSLAAALVVALAIPVLSTTSASAAPRDYSKIKNASQGGRLSGLEDACQKEGQVNVIALPHYWANYADMIAGFKAKYGVKVDEADPEAGSQDEIDAALRNKGTTRSQMYSTLD